MDIQIIDLYTINFAQASIISVAIFLTDFATGVIAGLRSNRRIRSAIMHQTLSKKVANYFNFLIIGLAFYLASNIGPEKAPLASVAVILVIIPAVPELLSLRENFRIIKTGLDTKPKSENAHVEKRN